MLKSLLPVFAIFISCIFVSCSDEPRFAPQLYEAENETKFSSRNVLAFNEAEMEILSQELDMDADISIPSFNAYDARGRSQILFTETDARTAALGRVLFYENRLSATGETNCSSCHKQAIAFSDDVAHSKGINGQLTRRNSIALGSVAAFTPEASGYSTSGGNGGGSPFFNPQGGSLGFFWDERAPNISAQSRETIENTVEMGRSVEEAAAELNQDEFYRILTYKAFGTEELNALRITSALEMFCATMNAQRTRFDQLRFRQTRFFEQNQILGVATEEEVRGQRLFNANCAGCHGKELKTTQEIRANNGLDLVYEDKGIGELFGDQFSDGVFKIPFLRNVSLTAPYMHDGRFATLREVIDHYSEGVQAHPNLHPLLKDENGLPREMNFSVSEKDALEAFLGMLVDENLLTDERFSDPFVR